MRISKIFVVICTLFITACSSIINGSTQTLSVEAEPNTALIQLFDSDHELIAEDTGTLELEVERGKGYYSGASYTLEISFDGYDTQIIDIQPKPDDWYVGGNLLIASVMGYLVVDPLTGGMWAIETEDGQEVNALKIKLLESIDLDDSENIKVKEAIEQSK